MATVMLSRRRALATTLASIAALATARIPNALASPGGKAVTTAERSIGASTYCTDSQEAKFLALINRYRAENGVRKLALSGTLGAAAEHHSKDMARYNYFSHTLRGGISWSRNIARHGYKASATIGENIAAGHASAEETFRQWRNSPGHNKNMLNPNYWAIGIGRASKRTSKYRWYWTTTFGGAQDGGASSC